MIDKECGDNEDDFGVFIVSVDSSHEFQSALKAVCDLAVRYNSHVALVHALEPLEFQQWGNVEGRLRAEQRRDAEQLLLDLACTVHDLNGQRPCLYIAEGSAQQIISDILNSEDNIKGLVFGAERGGSNPLVSYFSGKGLSSLEVPLFIIPSYSS